MKLTDIVEDKITKESRTYMKSVKSEFLDLCKKLKNNYKRVLKSMEKKNIYLNKLKFVEFNGDKSKDNSKVYIHDKLYVLKIREIRKEDPNLDFVRLIEYINELERLNNNLDYDPYFIIGSNVIKQIKEFEKRKMFIILTTYKGISLERFRYFLKDRNISKETRNRYAARILINFARFIIIVYHLGFYLNDKEIRNLGINNNLKINVLDEEMIHVYTTKSKGEIELLDLLDKVKMELFGSINYNKFTKQLKLKIYDTIKRNESGLRIKKRKREEDNKGPKNKKQKIINNTFIFNNATFYVNINK